MRHPNELHGLVEESVCRTLKHTGGLAPEFLTTEQAANFLSLHPQTLSRLVKRGKGPARVGHGKFARFALEELRRWMSAGGPK